MGEWEMSDTPKTDEVWGNMHGSGYQMMLLCQKLERKLAALQKECAHHKETYAVLIAAPQEKP